MNEAKGVLMEASTIRILNIIEIGRPEQMVERQPNHSAPDKKE